ncbi:MAG: glycosyltransferase, partial [Acidobacteriia bacterium]|nr:glycosyltransferase [Terriglobia bacterium]
MMAAEMMSGVTAVIANWNGGSLLAKVLVDLTLQNHPIRRIVVVDNGSTDDSLSIARGNGAHVIALEENTGFANAVNLGIASAATSQVAVINNDVELPPGWLSSLTAALDAHPEAWFATGKIYRAGQENVLDGTFDAISRAACPWRCGQGRIDGPQWSVPC